MAFPVNGVLDNFNRDNGAPGANWTQPLISGTNSALAIASNVLDDASSTSPWHSSGYWNPSVTSSADCEVYADFPSLGNNTTVFLYARITNPNGVNTDGYAVALKFLTAGTEEFRAYRIDDGVGTQLGATVVDLTFTAGDSLGLEASGTSISIYHKTGGSWSNIGSRTDSTYSAAGYIGLDLHVTSCTADNFGGGPFGGATTHELAAVANGAGNATAISQAHKRLAASAVGESVASASLEMALVLTAEQVGATIRLLWVDELTLPQNLLTSAGSVLEGFEAATDWNPVVAGDGSAADNEVDYKQGAQAVQFTAGANSKVRMDKVIDLAAVTGNMRLYRLAAAGNSAPSLFLSNDAGYTKYFQANIASYGRAGAWAAINMIPGDWTAAGGMLWTDGWVRMRYQLLSNEGTLETVDNWVAGVAAQGAVLLTFDDAMEGVHNLAYPAMAARRIRGTTYVITDLVGDAGYMTSAQLVALDAAGWAVANHTTDHTQLGTVDQATAQLKISGAVTALEGWGLSANALHFAFPNGSYNATALAALDAEGILTGRTIDSTTPMVMPYPDYRLIPSKTMAAATAVATVTGYLDEAKARGEILVLYLHDIVASGATGNEVNIADLESVLDYIIAEQIAPLTIADLHTLRSGSVTITRPW